MSYRKEAVKSKVLRINVKSGGDDLAYPLMWAFSTVKLLADD